MEGHKSNYGLGVNELEPGVASNSKGSQTENIDSPEIQNIDPEIQNIDPEIQNIDPEIQNIDPEIPLRNNDTIDPTELNVQDTLNHNNDEALELTSKTSETDENNNILMSQKSDKDGKKHKRGIADDLFDPELDTRNRSRTLRKFSRMKIIVFNIFTDFSKYIGWSKVKKPLEDAKKEVHFPDEIIEEYELKGDMAGKDRFVPKSKQPYRKPKTRRKSATMIIPLTKEFTPRIERIEDASEFNNWCENKILRCRLCKRPHKKKVNRKRQIELSDVTEGLLYTVTVAESFIMGHKATTITIALPAVDVSMNPGRVPSVRDIGGIGGSMIELHVSTTRIGILASNIWIFTYCIPMLFNFEKEDCPTQSLFWKLMEQYGAIAITVEDGSAQLLSQSINFYNYAKECMRVIKTLQLKLEFEGETKIQEPLHRGSGLQLVRSLKSSQISCKSKIDVKVAKEIKSETGGGLSDWREFSELSGQEKILSLKHLLNSTTEGYSLAQMQIRFLLDDIIESTSDVTNETDLLFTLGDMFDRITFMDLQSESQSKDHEMAVIRSAMTQFTKSIYSFFQIAQHILEKVMELRDMLQVSCEYLQNVCKIDLIKVIPEIMFKTWGEKKGCCGCSPYGDKKNNMDNGDYFIPKYQGNDLFRTYFEDLMTVPFIPAGSHIFRLAESSLKLDQFVTEVKLKFSESNSNANARNSFGSTKGTSESLQSIISIERKDSEPNEPILKPILVTKVVSMEKIEDFEPSTIDRVASEDRQTRDGDVKGNSSDHQQDTK